MTFKTERFFIYATPQVLCYDEPGDAAAATAAAGEAAAAAADAAAAAGDEGGDEGGGDDGGSKAKPKAKFTQEQLNTILAEDRRKEEAKRQKVGETAKQMEKRLQEAIKDARNSDELREGLVTDLEDLKASQRSEAEQREHVAARAKEEHDTQVATLQGAAEQWETLFKESTNERSLTDAAVEHDAYSPKQIVALLKDRTEMKPVKDSVTGETIPGKYESRTAVPIKGDDGEVMTAWKTPSEAVELMKNNPTDEDKNLFRNAVIAGIGGGTAASNQPGPKVDAAKLTAEEFAKRFAENPESLGLKPKNF